MHQQRAQRGFSLIEVVITLTIIAMAAAIAVPRLSAGAEETRAEIGARTIQAVCRTAAAHAAAASLRVELQFTSNSNLVYLRVFEAGTSTPADISTFLASRTRDTKVDRVTLTDGENPSAAQAVLVELHPAVSISRPAILGKDFIAVILPDGCEVSGVNLSPATVEYTGHGTLETKGEVTVSAGGADRVLSFSTSSPAPVILP